MFAFLHTSIFPVALLAHVTLYGSRNVQIVEKTNTEQKNQSFIVCHFVSKYQRNSIIFCPCYLTSNQMILKMKNCFYTRTVSGDPSNFGRWRWWSLYYYDYYNYCDDVFLIIYNCHFLAAFISVRSTKSEPMMVMMLLLWLVTIAWLIFE